MARDLAVFLRELLRRPGQIGAIAPSSASVARMMTEGLEQIDGPIVEIGPGTGSFTGAILRRGIAPENLTLLEMNPRFCEILRGKFPEVRVLNQPGQEISQLGLRDIGAVISGVPLLGHPQLQRDILSNAFQVLAPGAPFIQFTYASHCPVSDALQAALGIRATKRGTVWTNLPPARVFEFRALPH